jgi:hypothetical protein
MAGEGRRVAGVVGRVVDRLGMGEADTDDQKGSDQQTEHGGDHGFGTRGLDLLDVLVLH